MTYGTHLHAGDIALLPFPFSDSNTVKRRPVLVLTEPDVVQDFVCVAVTSSESESVGRIEIADEDLAYGRLPKRSWIRLGKVYTLNQSVVERTVGSLNDEALDRLRSEVCRSLGC